MSTEDATAELDIKLEKVDRVESVGCPLLPTGFGAGDVDEMMVEDNATVILRLWSVVPLAGLLLGKGGSAGSDDTEPWDDVAVTPTLLSGEAVDVDERGAVAGTLPDGEPDECAAEDSCWASDALLAMVDARIAVVSDPGFVSDALDSALSGDRWLDVSILEVELSWTPKDVDDAEPDGVTSGVVDELED